MMSGYVNLFYDNLILRMVPDGIVDTCSAWWQRTVIVDYVARVLEEAVT